MPKPKPDHREQVEIKVDRKLNEFLDDLSMQRTVGTAANGISSLGDSAAKIIQAFVGGGDAGLVGLLLASFTIDHKLDNRGEKLLNEFLCSIPNILADKNGKIHTNAFYPYPDVRRNARCLIVLDPADYPALPAQWSNIDSESTRDVFGAELFEEGLVSFLATGSMSWTSALKNKWFNEILFPSLSSAMKKQISSIKDWENWCLQNLYNGVPWMTLEQPVAAKTYSSDPPAITDLDRYGIDWRRFKNAPGSIGGWVYSNFQGTKTLINNPNEFFITIWNDDTTLNEYSLMWAQMTARERYALFIRQGGKTRTEITGLKDVLSAIDVFDTMNDILGAVKNIGSSVVGKIDDARQWAYEKSQLDHFHDALNGRSGGATAATNPAPNMEGENVSSIFAQIWPSSWEPPSSVYRFEMIHQFTECCKVAIPWYLGSKFAIQAAGAAGEIIPG